MGLRLASLITLNHGIGQGHTHFYNENHGNCEKYGENYYSVLPSNSKSCMGYRLTYWPLTLVHSKGQGHVYFNNEDLWNGDTG